MAVSDFTDLDLRLASAHVILANPKPPELNSINSISSLNPFVTQEPQFSSSKLLQPLSYENGELENWRNGFGFGIGAGFGFGVGVGVGREAKALPSQEAVSETRSELKSDTPTSALKRPGRKRGRKGSGQGVVLDPEQNPEWLPKGWKVVKRTRPNGNSAGSKDTYYHEPVKNRQFRSKREVLEYLANGTRATRARSLKRLKDKEDTTNTKPFEPVTHGSATRRRSRKRLNDNQDTANTKPLNTMPPINFGLATTPEKILNNAQMINFLSPNKNLKNSQAINFQTPNLPETTRWASGNLMENLFTPFGVPRVPGHAELGWQQLFTPLAYTNSGYIS